MASSKGSNASILATYFARTVSNVAQSVRPVDLEHAAAYPPICHVEEIVSVL